jgi:hypothetical protein
MYPCDHCHDLFLDHLYGLLEPEEAQGLRDHLAGCPACREALALAEKQQQLLARAAQVYREVPAFVPPAGEGGQPAPAPAAAAPAPATPATLPLPARRRRPVLRWLGAAVAACVAAAAAGSYALYAEGLGERKDAVAREQGEVVHLRAEMVLARTRAGEEAAALPARVKARFLEVQGVGPATYQPDGVSSYRVATKDLDNRPLPATVSARLVDSARNKTLFEQLGIKSKGEVVVSVPGGLKATGGAGLRLEVAARGSGDREESFQQELSVQAPSYLTHLVLNKAAYRIGEVLFFRTLTLERFSLRPPGQPLQLTYTLRDPRGAVVKQLPGQIHTDGIGGGDIALTPNLIDGEYTLEVAQAEAGPLHVLPQSRRLTVQHALAPELQLDRPQYQPGDTINAQYRGRRQENGAPIPNQPLTVKVMAEDRQVGGPMQMRTNNLGNADIKVPVPTGITTPLVKLEVQAHDGVKNEKLVQEIPVAVGRRIVEFFPEGGDLVAGLPSRVYFRLQTPPGQPAQLAGQIVDREGRAVAEVQAAPVGKLADGQGLGVFRLTPLAGQAYRLKITSPQGVTEEPALPSTAAEGVVLSVPAAVGREGEPIQAMVHATGAERPLLVLASCRGHVVDQQLVIGRPAGTEVRLSPVAGTRGVVRLTVYRPQEGQLVPVAERLTYQVPAEHLVLSLQDGGRAAARTYPPRSKVQLGVKATTEKGEPAPQGWVLAEVVDEQALAGTAKQGEAGPPAHFYLASAVPQAEQLEDANFLMREGPEARSALDLFLGTYGWRHFVAAEPGQVLAALKDRTGRAAATADGPAVFHHSNAAAVRAGFAVALGKEQDPLRQQAQAKQHELGQQIEQHERAAAAALADFEGLPREYLRLGLGVLAVGLLAVGALALLIGLVRALRGAGAPTASFATAFGALGLCLLLYALTGGLRVEDGRGGTDSTVAQTSPADRATASTDALAKRARELPPLGVAPASGVYTAAQEQGQVAAREKAKRDMDTTVALKKADLLEQLAQQRSANDLARRLQVQSSNKTAEAKAPYAAPHEAPRGPGSLAGVAGGANSGLMPVSPAPGAATPPPAPAGSGKGGTAAKAQQDGRPSQGVLRAYAHPQAFQRGLELQDTLYWNPALVIADGQGQFSFNLADNITTYRVLLYGHTPSGRLGYGQGTLEVRPAQK